MEKIIFIFLLFLCDHANSQTGWVLQTSETTNSLRDIWFINSQTGWICGESGKILKTTNGGTNWVNLTSFTAQTLLSIRFSDANNGYAAGGVQSQNPFCLDDDILAKTTDGGMTWITLISNATGDIFYDLAVLNKDTAFVTFAGSDNFCMATSGGSYKTFNSGSNWNIFAGSWRKGISFINLTTGWQTNYSIGDVMTGYFSVYKTTNTGVNWNIVYSDVLYGGSNIGKIRFVDSSNGYCYYRMLRKTTNGGVNWQKIDSVTTYNLRSFAVVNKDTLWIVQGLYNVKRTNDGGINWVQQFTSGVILNSVFFIDKSTGWITGNGGIIYKTITGGVTGIQYLSSEIPKGFLLEQNYPNPFNPVTNIKFQIEKPCSVKLSVFDILGKEVTALVNEFLEPGTYKTAFDASFLPSGLYFYKISAGEFTLVKRMVLIR